MCINGKMLLFLMAGYGALTVHYFGAECSRGSGMDRGIVNCAISKQNSVSFMSEKFGFHGFRSRGLLETHETATCNSENISAFPETAEGKTLLRWPAAGPTGCTLTCGQHSGK
jgi:hypothetical protein